MDIWKGALLVIAGLVALASAIAWPIVYYNHEVTKMLVEGGYEQDTLQGQGGVYWVKKKQGN